MGFFRFFFTGFTSKFFEKQKGRLERGERAATGVVKKGIQAMRLRVNGYSTREIGARLGAPDNYVTAWEAKARKYLRAMN